MLNNAINEDPQVLCAEIDARIRTAKPTAADIAELKRQLRSRHAIPNLELKPDISSEEILEGFFRCVLAHFLHQRFELHIDAIPDCINSSHKAVRRVCAAPIRHRHHDITDEAWARAWARMQQEHREVSGKVPKRRSQRRADLYIVVRDKVVSFEFRYIDAQRLRTTAGCRDRMQHYAARQAQTFLVLYCGGPKNDVLEEALDSLCRLDNAGSRIVGVHGPAIPVVRGAAPDDAPRPRIQRLR